MSGPNKMRKSSAKRKNSSSRKSIGLIEKSDKMKGTETDFEELVIDRTVTPQRKLNVNEVKRSEESSSSSQWRKRLESTLLGGEQTPPTERARNNRHKKSCFNCEGEHNLYDCPHPRDERKIAASKRKSADEFRRRQQINNGLTKHIDKGFKPGEISEELRSALGLKEKDIPEHVYRMRRLGFIKGYPPGWLRKAVKCNDDNLKFFTSSSDEKKNDEELPVLDVKKLIWYPGFNGDGSMLNDMESFKVPPQNVFWEAYQKELQDQFSEMKKLERKREKRDKNKNKKSTHKKFDDDDVIIVEADSKSDKFTTPGEEKSVMMLNGTPSIPIKSVEKPCVEMGDSIFQTVGTPAPYRQNLTDVVSLEAFAVGIQPFESREEETVNKGNFRKLMDCLKVLREQNDAPEIILLGESESQSQSSDDVVMIDQEEVEEEEEQAGRSGGRKRSGKRTRRGQRKRRRIEPKLSEEKKEKS